MRSSSGQYYVALDHVRALAAILVITWHFVHVAIPVESCPSFIPLVLFEEGHTGVALFMTLSGYLFCKLLGNKRIRFAAFLWNRFIRLVPLLVVVILLAGVECVVLGRPVNPYLERIIYGPLLPTLPNGGWSITVEFHFYLLLPFLLLLLRHSPKYVAGILVLSLATRGVFFLVDGTVRDYAYLTLIGRIDQFICGMLGYQMRSKITGKALLPGLAAIAFLRSLDISMRKEASTGRDRSGSFFRL